MWMDEPKTETLRIRYAAGHVVALLVEDGPMTVQQVARALVCVIGQTQGDLPAGGLTVAAAVRAAGGPPPELTEGDEVQWKGRRVVVCSAQGGAVIFTSPGPVVDGEEMVAGSAAYGVPRLVPRPAPRLG